MIERRCPSLNTHEANGLAERYIHSLIDVTRCFMVDSRFPNFLRGEVVATAVALDNRKPKANLNDFSPEQRQTRYPPDMALLRVICCYVVNEVHWVNASVTNGLNNLQMQSLTWVNASVTNGLNREPTGAFSQTKAENVTTDNNNNNITTSSVGCCSCTSQRDFNVANPCSTPRTIR